MILEIGLIDYYKPISFYWPEFAKNGKENFPNTTGGFLQ